MSNDLFYPYREIVDKLEIEIQALIDENTLNPLLSRRLLRLMGYVRDLRGLRSVSTAMAPEVVAEAQKEPAQSPPVATPCPKFMPPQAPFVSQFPTSVSEKKSLSWQEAASMGESARPGEVMTLDILGLKTNFHWCPPGTFMMGSPESEEYSEEYYGRWETQHEVTLTRGFWLAETPVTVEAFRKFFEASKFRTFAEVTGGKFSWKRQGWHNMSFDQILSNPVVFINWYDAKEYVAWLSANCAPNGLIFQLPSEAHWEYACRAGTTTRFSWGDDWDPAKANTYCDGTKPVGFCNYANAWGLKDMHGGVSEWCEDWYKDYASVAATDPTGPDEGTRRVARGGCWASSPKDCKSASRIGAVPLYSCNNSLGFRIEAVFDSK